MTRTAFQVPDPQTGTIYHIAVAAPSDGTSEPRAAHREAPDAHGTPPTRRPSAPATRTSAATPRREAVPAVLFMDGDDQFEAAVSAYQRARETGRVPPLLLAGIGYGASYTKPGNFRVRDYTPTALATEQGSGGADRFLAWLTDTLWPELTRRYPIRDDVRGLAGHSLGSLLVVHALLQRRPWFNRFLASSPSLWWDDRAVLCSGQRLQRTGVALPARLFLSVGEEDTTSMTTDLDLFEQQLAAAPFPELTVISRRFPGRDHYNVLEDAFDAGLQALFGDVD